jgi:2-polyprenyl-3-methyl-5-hydroxy-6-metoxy-1,4-benzoquinol methylase
MPGCEDNIFLQANLFEFNPDQPFDVVNSLGVLHHTADCQAAIRRVLQWIAPKGYLHLGLYHLYGRRPFLGYFADLRARGASETDQYEAFKELNSSITDETHMLSWFRDQVLHPHETQHTYEELHDVLTSEGFIIEATSINNFKRLPSLKLLIEMERRLEDKSKEALYRRKRYFPGFVVVWARRR